MDKKIESKCTLENYFSSFSNEQKKDMINNLEAENNRLRLQILNNNKLIDLLKNNGQAVM